MAKKTSIATELDRSDSVWRQLVHSTNFDVKAEILQLVHDDTAALRVPDRQLAC